MINKDLKNTKFHFHLYNFRGDVTVRSQLANISTHPSIWRTSSWSTGGTTSLSRMPSPSRCSSNSFLVKYRLWWVLFCFIERFLFSPESSIFKDSHWEIFCLIFNKHKENSEPRCIYQSNCRWLCFEIQGRAIHIQVQAIQSCSRVEICAQIHRAWDKKQKINT